MADPAAVPPLPGAGVPPLPGAVGVTHLRVYDSVAPDGLRGGSPHVHFACTEAYLTVAGKGRVQTLGADGFHELTLEPGRLVWFTPGLIHRLINDDGRLEIQVIMQNAGLPEAGDFVLVFPDAVLSDPAAYREAASIAATGHVYAGGEEASRRRRDLAVEGFLALRERFEREGVPALDRFYKSAIRHVQPSLGRWRNVWESGPVAATQRTGEQLDALERGDVSHLSAGGVYALPAPWEERKLGVCGTLGLYLPEGGRI